MRRRTVGALGLVAAALLLFVVIYQPLLFVETGEYQTASVTVSDENDTHLGTVDVRIADTDAKRRVGLSRTDSLESDEGMLFVHSETGQHAYIMRGMDFSIDILFVAKNGTVTRIHHAASPEWVPLSRYRGTGRYVLEVTAGWAERTGVETGDTVRIPDSVTANDTSFR
jgi:uncharacterized membrane protein (UPF0127 family)